MRSAFVVGVLLVSSLVGLPAAAASSAQAGPGVEPSAPEQTIRYPFVASDLPGSQLVKEQGAKGKNGGCTFEESGRGTQAAGPTIDVAREVAFDPGTCTHTLAEATYTPDTLPAAYRDDLVKDSAAAGRGRDQVEPLTTVYIGQIKVNVEDPAQIDVSSTTAKVTWSGGSCVNSSNHYAYWGWYSPSGWQRTNASWAYGRNCSRAYTNVLGKYKNVPFCWPWTTYTNHSKTWFEGRPYGGWYWAYTVSKSGGCTSLLHYERIITTP